MRKAVILLIVSLPAVCLADLPAAAPVVSEEGAAKAGLVSSTELINNARKFDGQTVVYIGEAVGDVMVRGDFAWVNINDGENAIGVWLSKELAGEIRFTGSYHIIGDRVEITGVFNRNCQQHGGDMDIHAQSIHRISPGKVVGTELNTTKRDLVFVLLVMLGLVLVFVRRPKSGVSR
ncbi:MAG: hypothetical protein JW947_10030 [Sedimentisphaerales bacterium]|nr:hypothetical protein [Sedimentisphaerales bacterium]